MFPVVSVVDLIALKFLLLTSSVYTYHEGVTQGVLIK